jgi:phage repressor protein C with HTH and peptisase S24 domain
MMQKLLFVFCLIAMSAGTAAAQKTITNADLEGYKQARLKAEREYRESYERLGMPSPEELRRRSDESIKETVEMSERLKQQRLEEERLEIERLRAIQAFTVQYPSYSESYQVSPGYFISPGFQYYNDRRRPRFRPFTRNIRQGYFAGGQFWPAGPRTVSRPIVRIRRR